MKRILTVLLILVLIPSFSGCLTPKYKQDKIIDTFDSFDHPRDFILATAHPDVLYVRDKVFDCKTMTYNESQCEYITTTETCTYFFAYRSEEKNAIDILLLPFDTFELSHIDTLEIESEIQYVSLCHDSEVYFSIRNKDSSYSYLVYNLETKESYFEKSWPSYDERNTAGSYTITYDRSSLMSKIIVKNNETGEEKTIDFSLHQTCEEGRIILNLGSLTSITSPLTHIEHNGEIYIIYIYLIDGFLGYPSYLYIMKYDFESHTMKYHSSIFMEDYPEGGINDFIILD